MNVNVLVFNRFPKSFYPDVVQAQCPAVHADLDLMEYAGLQSPFAGVLASLFRVNDFGRSVGLELMRVLFA